MVIGGANGSAVLANDKERLDLDAVPEYVREPRGSSKDSYASRSSYGEEREPGGKRSAEIETLWPGVSADFLHGSQTKRQSSFYLAVGFMGGVVATLVVGGIVFGGIHMLHRSNSQQSAPQIVVAGTRTQSSAGANIATESGATIAVVTTRKTGVVDPEVIVPLYSTYTVQTGDTLAGIAFKAYKRATPRLLDEICKANGMRNANVLSLGQTLNLPEYRPLNRQQVASGGEGTH